MKKTYTILLLWMLIAAVIGRKKEDKIRQRGSHKPSRRLTYLDTENDNFLRIASDMKNQNATSGAEIQFKCKVEAKSMKNIRFTWYKDGEVIVSERDRRFLISSRPWGSKLRIKALYTFDSGRYRCEVSNGVSYAYTSAVLSVSFERPPPLQENEKPKIKIPQGKCEKYKGIVCRDYLGTNKIFVDAFENQNDMEQQISAALTLLSESHSVSEQCQKFALPAFCHYVFPICVDAVIKQSGARLCKEDCEKLKTDTCHAEYLKGKRHPLLKILFETANCSHLPSNTNALCVSVGLPTPPPPSPKENNKCYNEKGEKYKGSIKVAKSGQLCAMWPKHFSEKHPELQGHNFCRNPNQKMSQPWCFVNVEGSLKATPCDITQCEISFDKQFFFLAAFGTAGILVLLFIVVMARCMYLKMQKNTLAAPRLNKKSIQLEVNDLSICATSELGFSKYGKVFEGIIVNDPRFSEKQPFAFKIFDRQHTKVYLEQFKREIAILSKLNHPNITNLKGLCMNPNMRCTIFEYTNQVNLHEYLVLNSPHIWKPQTDTGIQFKNSNMYGVSTDLLIATASQIASAMSYLNSKQFIHHDLSARNVLICGSMEVKVCTLGCVKNAYLSNYHKTAQGTLLPIRWMAPESLHSWKFSDKSTVWSFGVLLWEMFGYGLQPYCGYTNHEVLEMISRRHLLTCPDQCPAKIYSLMQECWSAQPNRRPSFTSIFEQLQEFCNFGTVTVVNSIMNSSADDAKRHWIEEGNFIPINGDPPSQDTVCLLEPQKKSDFYPK